VIDYRRAFAAIRKDPLWKRKLALGVLIQLIPYVGTVWMLGWEMEYQRNVAWGNDEHLPDWSSFSTQALLGVKALVAALPYSLVACMLIFPSVMTAAVVSVAADSGDVPRWLGIAALIGGSFVMPLALMLLILPLSGSAMLRVALYGTIESGLQFKEIFRLMRERKRELLRAWGFSVLNIAILLGAMVVFSSLVGLLVILVPGPTELRVVAMLLLGTAAYFVCMFLSMALSLYLGLATMHFFGSYGRAAYRLDERQESQATGVSSSLNCTT
jgi:hypothetical protein